MAHAFQMTHRVEFADTDAAGIIHFSTYFRWMEVTEHAFFRSLGLSIQMAVDGEPIGWPRVHVECDFRQPVRFEDEVLAQLRVREKREKSLTYEFAFVRQSDGAEIARGRLITVCVSRATGTMRAVPIPAAIADRIEVAPAEDDTASPHSK